MIDILVVEDDANKKISLAAALGEIDCVEPERITWVSDVVAAKRAMEENGYDLLLLDIHLPKRPELPPTEDGGLEVLRWLKARGTPHRPAYIIGTTAYENSLKLGSKNLII